MNDFPTQAIADAAAAAARGLRLALAGHPDEVRIQVQADGSATVNVPGAAFELFLQILDEMADGNSVTIVPMHAELTTQQAADLLHVSRPYLVGLLDTGKIPHRMVGTRRRVLAKDVLMYKKQDDDQRQKVLDQLSADAEELDMGY